MPLPTNSPVTFGERAVTVGRERGRLCVGIDPHPHLLAAWGLSADVDGLRTFTMTCVEAFVGTAAMVKPQVAFFERYGSQGFAVLEEALAALRENDCLSLADAKRGDIGSTMAGYAEAWLGENSPLRADAVTVSPYLGVGALSPVFDMAEDTGRGVFVLAATSNPEAKALQSLTVDGRSVAQRVVDELAERNAAAGAQADVNKSMVGALGVVVGATLDTPPKLDQLNGPVLLPGVGAQGATPADVRALTKAAPELGFANVSRAILSRGPKVADLRKAVIETAAEFRD